MGAQQSLSQMNLNKQNLESLRNLERQMAVNKQAIDTRNLLEEKRLLGMKSNQEKSDYAQVLLMQAREREIKERMEKDKDKAFAQSELN